MALSPPQIAESFHLALLSVLSHELGEASFVLKGGANLRYFFGSERYSEDIDLDVVRMKSWQVREKVDRALGSQRLSILLRSDRLEVSEFSAPKQTETTQRWKVAVNSTDSGQPVRTKVEFSHRRNSPRFRLDRVPEEVLRPYALRPPAVQHYLAEAAIDQKVHALAGRSETQARDVFDLDLLFRRSEEGASPVDADVRELASERCLDLGYEAYRDQVLPFLEPEIADLYGSRSSWETMQTNVLRLLEDPDGTG